MANSTVLGMLKEKGYTGGMLALKFKVHRSLVYASISGQGSREIRVSIAKIINQSPSSIWVSSPKSKLLVDDYEYMNS